MTCDRMNKALQLNYTINDLEVVLSRLDNLRSEEHVVFGVRKFHSDDPSHYVDLNPTEISVIRSMLKSRLETLHKEFELL